MIVVAILLLLFGGGVIWWILREGAITNLFLIIVGLGSILLLFTVLALVFP
jgi:hypothetical protein